MHATNEQGLQVEDVVRLLRAARLNDAGALPAQPPGRTPQCLPIGRILTMTRSRARLSPGEQAHFNTCAFCQRVARTFLGGGPPADPDGGTVVSGGEGTVVFSSEDTRVEPPKT